MTTLEHDVSRQHALSHAVELAAALGTALRLGILAHLDREPADAADTARHCATAPDVTARLLDALHAAGVLARDHAGRYAVTADGRWSAAIAGGWARLDDVVRTGTPLVAAHTPTGAGELYPEVVAGLSRLFAGAATEVAGLVDPPVRVLDVGAGAAPWSIAVAARHPESRVTALDVPDVLPVTRAAVAEAGLAGRFDYLAGDVFTLPLAPGAYDLIVLGNVCHLFDADTNRRLLARLRPALGPTGTLAIVDALPSDDREDHEWLSLYGLGLRMRTRSGAVYPPAAYRDWTASAGYGPLSTVRVGGLPPLNLLRCTRG
jgi:SAM-dependent methyltransferase